ncbi:MAG TPA: DUF5916 domain-containing protein [Gemmatimonadales bacterium]|nr:carbohydrate binding family 9 domain-containing protein [Gemmatimonadales bacterium]HPF61372.1 DUF5916 domain-containing protein [Gemmatimonadales bacterium]
MPRLALLAALLLAAPLAAQGPVVTVPEGAATDSLTLDGALDEPVWQRASRLDGFYQFRPVDSRPAEDSTVVLLWYSRDALHVGILAYDRQPGSVRATVSDRDNIGNDDRVTVYLDTFNDRRRAYFFGVNPFGIQDDGVRSEGGFSASSGGSGSTDRNPDFIWQSKGRRTPFGWSAELRIPFKSLRWGGGGTQTWGFNVERITKRTGYEDTWTDVRRANASFLAQAGTITGLEDIHRGVVTELQPTFVANAPGVRGAAAFERGDVAGEFGGNFRLGFTNMTLDGTVNPDFSQVESDVGLVTINERFALFFPERRPFFLEGIELFASPNNLVYTRTVANPLAGAKLTGKLGRWSIAHLTAIDEFVQSPVGDPDRNAVANITRVRRDVGQNSVAGLTVTNRDEDADYNRVIAADTRLVFGQVYYFQGQLGAAFTRDGRDDDVRSDPLWELEVDRTGRAWGFNYKVTAVGDDFETWSGFVNRPGVTTARAFNRYTVYGARGATIEQFTVFGGGNRIYDYGNLFGATAIEGANELNLSSRIRGGWNLSSQLSLGFVRFNPEDYATLTVDNGEVPPTAFDPATGVFDGFSWNAQVTTPTWRTWDASLRYQNGVTAIFPEASEGRLSQWRGSLNLRPTRAVRVTGSLTLQHLRRASDRSEFARTILPRVKVEVQPNRALFFRVVGEYRSERQDGLVDAATGRPLRRDGALTSRRDSNRLRVDWLASLEPTPGTVAFLGYGSTLEGDETLTFRNLRRRDDAFFLKLAYLFRL